MWKHLQWGLLILFTMWRLKSKCKGIFSVKRHHHVFSGQKFTCLKCLLKLLIFCRIKSWALIFIISDELNLVSTPAETSRIRTPDIQNMTVEKLRALLKEKGLSLRGRKVSICITFSLYIGCELSIVVHCYTFTPYLVLLKDIIHFSSSTRVFPNLFGIEA